MINILITGGAGFIGSNLVEHYLNDSRINVVRVLDNLSNGRLENIEKFSSNPRFEFVQGDIRDYATCIKACHGMHKVSHQAALGSVPRSIENPMLSTEVNILGTVNVMHAAIQEGVERVILAFSSSTYGDNHTLPKVESHIGSPLSPYAITKYSIEQFADVFSQIYGLNWIGLRYFNVFGPKQDPQNPYAAVIPTFIQAFQNNGKIVINGDGHTSRDFTHVSNVIKFHDLSLFTQDKKAMCQTYNVACGDRTSLNTIVDYLERIFGYAIPIEYGPERRGDVKHSQASIKKGKHLLGYEPSTRFLEGLKHTVGSFNR